MSNRIVTGVLVGLFVVATSAGTLGAWSYSARTLALLPEYSASDEALELPVTNATAKGDRLPVAPTAVLAVKEPAASEPVSTPPAAVVPTSYSVAALTAYAVQPRMDWIEPRTESRKPAVVEKPKRAPEPPQGFLDDAQIAGIKTRLKLTEAQAEYWPAVEVALREVVRRHTRNGRKSPTIAPQIDLSSPEVQQLIAAATPLIMRLREDQKREVRTLARVIGLETIASQI